MDPHTQHFHLPSSRCSTNCFLFVEKSFGLGGAPARREAGNFEYTPLAPTATAHSLHLQRGAREKVGERLACTRRPPTDCPKNSWSIRAGVSDHTPIDRRWAGSRSAIGQLAVGGQSGSGCRQSWRACGRPGIWGSRRQNRYYSGLGAFAVLICDGETGLCFLRHVFNVNCKHDRRQHLPL